MIGQQARSVTAPDAHVSPCLVALLALACGVAVANLYYAQPLLHTLGRAFGVSNAAAGLLVTVTQAGYVIGLALLVPVGDLLERRALITTTMVVTAAGLVVAAVAPGIALFAIAIGVVGITSVVAQVIVPMSSSLAAESERGRVVGTVMSGLLIGILGARTASGLIAQALGWRAVFVAAAAAMLVLAATMRRALPRVPPTTDLGYGDLLRSVLKLIGEEPVLRRRMALGALGFGCFSILWTAVAFLLSAPPFNYGNGVIGLFGLAGIAGALAASAAGRLADRGLGSQTTTAALILLLASWAALAAGARSAIILIAGIVLLDLGVQGLHISNQSVIYALRPEARSRLTTAYMVSCFLGATVLSALTTTVYASDGWSGVCVLGAIVSVIALVVWIVTALEPARRGRPLEPARASRPLESTRASRPLESTRASRPLEPAPGEAE